MLKYLIILLLFSTTIFSVNRRVDERLLNTDFSIYTSDGLEYYHHIKFVHENNFGRILRFYYFDSNTNSYKFMSLRKPYLLIQTEKDENVESNYRNRKRH